MERGKGKEASRIVEKFCFWKIPSISLKQNKHTHYVLTHSHTYAPPTHAATATAASTVTARSSSSAGSTLCITHTNRHTHINKRNKAAEGKRPNRGNKTHQEMLQR